MKKTRANSQLQEDGRGRRKRPCVDGTAAKDPEPGQWLAARREGQTRLGREGEDPSLLSVSSQ